MKHHRGWSTTHTSLVLLLVTILTTSPTHAFSNPRLAVDSLDAFGIPSTLQRHPCNATTRCRKTPGPVTHYTRRLQQLNQELPRRHKVPLTTTLDTDDDGMPKSFSWQEYLAMYPDVLELLPGASEEGARLHYYQFGYKEGRLPRLPPVVMQYTVCGTSIEQLYAHLHAWVLAVRLGAGCVLPPGIVRPRPDTWHPAPLDAMLNVNATVFAARKLYLAMLPAHETDWRTVKHNGQVSYNYADITRVDPDEVIAQWNPQGIEPWATMQLNVLYKQAKPLDPLVDWIMQAIGQRGIEMYRSKLRQPNEEVTLLLQLPCTLFAIEAIRSAKYMEATAQLLSFNKQLERLAQQLMSVLRTKSHLQKYHAMIISSQHDVDVWLTPAYPVEAGRLSKAYRATFVPPMPCFVAFEDEWLLVQDAGRTESLKLAMLQGAQGGCRSITTRADLAKQHPSLRATLDHLTQEQRVVVELLVASRAVRVVGSAESLMTVFVSEWRGLREAEVAVVRVQAAPQAVRSKLDADPLLRVAALTTRHNMGLDTTAMPKLFSEDAPLLRQHGVAV